MAYIWLDNARNIFFIRNMGVLPIYVDAERIEIRDESPLSDCSIIIIESTVFSFHDLRGLKKGYKLKKDAKASITTRYDTTNNSSSKE
ncbi:hypothetical protein MXB_1706 [Myxobolus squamalis]|nr:hypothetical protein MXB_1706 [Myxobolus squamalis]